MQNMLADMDLVSADPDQLPATALGATEEGAGESSTGATGNAPDYDLTKGDGESHAGAAGIRAGSRARSARWSGC